MRFSKEIKIGDKIIGKNHPTYIIAEIGANFNGDINVAKELIKSAKECGADCAKFQTFISEKIVSDNGFSLMELKGVHGTWGKTVGQVFKEVEFPREWHQELLEYANSIGIHFSTSPYDFEAVDLCQNLDLPFIKIGSGEITWLEMIKYISQKNKPVFLATGDATMSEIDEAIRTIEETGNENVVLMQCITNYPSKIENANINVLKNYQNSFEILTGYSDHSPGPVVSLGAVSLGAVVIEKHFTLDKNDKGPDHPHSMNPVEFKLMVDQIRDLEKALGNSRKVVVEEESETVFVQRRSLYINKNLQVGDTIKEEDIIVLRPALGIPPKFKNTIIGSKLKTDIKEGFPIFWDNIL
jgi:sialic acid synthase SpsE